jgi:hypothetical protein
VMLTIVSLAGLIVTWLGSIVLPLV